MAKYDMRPLPCDPQRIKGMLEKLIVSHYQNNYGGAVKRLNLITRATCRARLQYGARLPHQRAQARGVDRDQLDDSPRAVLRQPR
jgi:hypothetical protein